LFEVHDALGEPPPTVVVDRPSGPLTGSALGEPENFSTPPPTLPGYDLLEELGRGGMGVVYKARQNRLNRQVAVNMVVAGAFASPVARLRFLAEAEVIARLHHPHIVQVYEVGQHAGHPFIVQEYVGGGTLADRLRHGPLPPPEAARLT